MGKHIRLALVVLAIAVAGTSGCGLCLLPCYVCLPTGELALQDDEARAEIGPGGIPGQDTAAQVPAR